MPERLPTPYFDLPTPLVIAHQGGNRLRPGNTFAAFDHAVALGADVLEMDLHASRDGHLVVIHDATLERTTDGHGPVNALTLAEVKRLDAGYHWPFVGKDGQPEFELPGDWPVRHPYRATGLEIPAFADVLDRYPDMRLNVEIKQADPSITETLCNVLKRTRRGPLTLVASFDDATLASFRQDCPDVATSASSREVGWFAAVRQFGLTRLFTSPALALQIPQERDGETLVDERILADAQELHLHVDFWTVNDRESLARVLAAGADGVITDRPDLLLEMLER